MSPISTIPNEKTSAVFTQKPIIEKVCKNNQSVKREEKEKFVWNNHREKKSEVKLQFQKTLASKQLHYSKHRIVNIASIDPKITVTISNTNISTAKRCKAYKFTKISP